jgi:uncharacterized radical SAM superfamily protein
MVVVVVVVVVMMMIYGISMTLTSPPASNEEHFNLIHYGKKQVYEVNMVSVYVRHLGF